MCPGVWASFLTISSPIPSKVLRWHDTGKSRRDQRGELSWECFRQALGQHEPLRGIGNACGFLYQTEFTVGLDRQGLVSSEFGSPRIDTGTSRSCSSSHLQRELEILVVECDQGAGQMSKREVKLHKKDEKVLRRARRGSCALPLFAPVTTATLDIAETIDATPKKTAIVGIARAAAKVPLGIENIDKVALRHSSGERA